MIVGFRRLHRAFALLAAASFLGCQAAPSREGPGAPQTIAVQINPAEANVGPGGTVSFAAVVTGTANTSVLWAVREAGGGAVNASGLYTAPSSTGTFHVTATSAADGLSQAEATVTVAPPPPPPPPVTVTISPTTGNVDACRTLQFTATVTGTSNTAVTWSVQEGASGGTINSSGRYTAASGPGTYHVVATPAADPARATSAAVTVVERILSVAVSPTEVTVAPGGNAQLTATVTNTCGTFSATSTITSSGMVVPNGSSAPN